MKKLITTTIVSIGLAVFGVSAQAHKPLKEDTMHNAIDRSCERGKVKLILRSSTTGEKMNATVDCDDAKKMAHHREIKAHGIHVKKQ